MVKTIQFDSDVAKKFGIDEAIIIYYLKSSINVHKDYKKNLVDGKTWTPTSINNLQEHFPFWTADQIERIMKSLVDKKIIMER